ncbi:MAG: ankyrin repeat domain-containing protein [Verrucomicrobiaceae bacterium]|jgi:ankyrin repeat protein|nr:ankyrin repeat domain-containing protein [Verrucomicrobiaceae bacterium]
MSANGDPRFYEIRNVFLENMDEALARVRGDRSLLDVRSGLGETLLHWSAIEYREDIVKALLDLGASVDPTNHFGSTPFAEAAQLRNENMCRLLLKHGAAIDPVNQNGETPLMLAAFMGDATTCRFLLGLGASAALINSDGESVLAVSARSGRIEVVEAVLEHLDPKIDVNILIGDSDRFMLEQIGSDIANLLQKRGMRQA